MDHHSLLQGIFLIQGLNSGLLNHKQMLYHLSHQGSLVKRSNFRRTRVGKSQDAFYSFLHVCEINSLPFFCMLVHTRFCLCPPRTSLVAQTVEGLPAMQETQVQSLGWEDPLEKEMAPHSSTVAWKTPWTTGRLQSMGSQRAGHD